MIVVIIMMTVAMIVMAMIVVIFLIVSFWQIHGEKVNKLVKQYRRIKLGSIRINTSRHT